MNTFTTIPKRLRAIQAMPRQGLRAFHGSEAIKKFYLGRVQMHKKADEIVAGVYWENGKGCGIGCTLHSNNHAAYETELGIPQILARLEDSLFERIFPRDPTFAKAWPERFLKAPKSGADLSMVWPRFALWLLVDEKEGVIRFAKTERTQTAIADVAELYRRWVAGTKPEREEWMKARSAAYAADAYAAYDADAYAAYATAAAAYAAANAYAAYATANAYAYAAYAAYAAAYAARKKIYIRCAEKLLELMSAA